MADEIETTETKTDDSIASLLASAVTEHEEAETPSAPNGADKEAAAEPVDAAATEGAPEAAEAEKAAQDAAAAEGAAKETEAKAEPEKPAKEGGGAEAPSNWSKRDKEMFTRVADPAVQSWLLERSRAMEADYTRKTQLTAQLRKEYEPVDALFSPHREVMAAKGFTPAALIQRWMNVEQRLAAGEDTAVAVIQGLVGGYNIPLPKIAAALGLAAAQAQRQEAKPGAESGIVNGQAGEIQLPPAVTQKLDALARIQERLDREDREKVAQAQHAARAAEETETRKIDDFKSETDGKGNLLHPHFQDVEGDMLNLALGYRASNKPIPPLKELYERAVHANPATRAKVLTAQRQQEEAAQREADRKKAAQAKKASASVTGSPTGTGKAPDLRRGSEKSLREQLEEAWADTSA